MGKGRNGVLRFELLALCLMTLVSFSSFYFDNSLPDNYLVISSENANTNILSYSFFSIVSWAGFYVGPWVFLPFIFFTLFYTFSLSKREHFLDTISIIPLLIFFSTLSAYMAPEIVGKGLRYLFSSYLGTLNTLAVGLLSGLIFLSLTYRSSFKAAVVSFFMMLGKGISSLFQIRPKSIGQKPLEKINSFKEKFSVVVPSILKGEKREKLGRESFESYSPRTKVIDEADSVSSIPEVSELTPLASAVERKEESGEPTDSKEKEAVKTYKKKNQVKQEKQYYSIVETLSKSQRRGQGRHPDENYFDKIITALEDTLGEFKIDGKIVNVLKGPVVDTFELELGPGVKVSKVTNSENELSMALLGAPIRIVYPMIGRATVGIEVPRNPREIIYLDEVLSTREYQKSKMKLPVAMGKNAFGETFVVDLASMPHMLVAGATGAGKSVFINTLLVSLLAKKSPRQMKLILIDPKQLELALYATLPHLVMPVITAPKEASISLLWACQEMERRYSILKEFGVRNIEGFNEKLKDASPELLAKIHHHYENEPDDYYELPYLVIIVDEFADLILTKAGKEIENNICRLAAKARAAGIHLVLATQRPSVDVITGLIKSNFPTRVSFRVTSSVDSRTILNSTGAEKLLGKGDMLYRHGTDNLRVHSSYVDENEIEAMTTKLAEMPRDFHTGAMSFLENGGEQELDPYSFGSHIPQADSSGSDDEYFKDAVRIVVEHRTASASMLQRRMKIGYNRAANLIEEMESKGIVGPAEGSKRRKVLLSSEELS